MSSMERGAETASQILDKRDPYGSELRDNTFCRRMLTEAYALGVVAGIVQAQAGLGALHAKANAEAVSPDFQRAVGRHLLAQPNVASLSGRLP